MVWVDWLECWIRAVSCIIVTRRSRTLGRGCGNIFNLEHRCINYILSLALNDVNVPFNYNPNVWELGPLGLYRLWGANGPHTMCINIHVNWHLPSKLRRH